MVKRLLILLLLVQPCYAGPKHFFKGIGSQFKQTFWTDVREHPYAWGLQLGIRTGLFALDQITSCKGYNQGMPEAWIGKYVIGSHPSCAKGASIASGAFIVNQMSVNWLAHSFKESCDREAANPNSLWWKVDSHTKSTEACFWGASLADTLVQGGLEIPAIRNNFDWLDRNKQFQKQCKEAQFCNP